MFQAFRPFIHIWTIFHYSLNTRVGRRFCFIVSDLIRNRFIVGQRDGFIVTMFFTDGMLKTNYMAI